MAESPESPESTSGLGGEVPSAYVGQPPNNSVPASGQNPTSTYSTIAPPPKQHGGGTVRRVFTALLASLFLLSIVANVYLYVILMSLTAGPIESIFTEGDHKNRIVILPINGLISDQQVGFVRAALSSLKQDPPKALILRVQSPGGGIGPSDRIAHLLEDYKKARGDEGGGIIVASFGSIAASGGYYIAAGCDHIVAEPTTITGSIGVIAQGFTIAKLLQTIGIKPETITSTHAYKKDMLDWTRDWTDTDRRLLRRFLDHGQERFVQIVHHGRRKHLSLKQVNQIATGEPFTAQEALDNKLIDEEGYIEDAIDAAKKLLGMTTQDQPEVTIMRQPTPLLKRITGVTGFPVGDRLGDLSFNVEQTRQLLIELTRPRLEYRLDLLGP